MLPPSTHWNVLHGPVGLATGDATCACSFVRVLEAIGARLSESEVLRMRGTRRIRVHEL